MGGETNSPTDNNLASGSSAEKLRLWRRMGVISMIILIGGTIIILACVGFLGFLWFSTVDNNTWHRIIINNWALRSVTLTSVILRVIITAQSGISLSILAAILLEKSSTPLSSVGAVSIIRAYGDKSLLSVLSEFVWPLLQYGPWGQQLILPMIGLTLVISTLSQGISTILLSDITLQPIPGYSQRLNINYDYTFKAPTLPQDTAGFSYTPITSSSLWQSNLPAFWPAFAEYSEPPIQQENVSDTGVSLRAFLPLSTPERSILRNYSGKSLVLDSRVTCQQPVFEDIQFVPIYGPSIIQDVVTGRVGPSTLTPRLDNPGMVNFTCGYYDSQWSICELPNEALYWRGSKFSGGLVSEFREFPPSPAQNKSGAALLIINGGVSATGSEFTLVAPPDSIYFLEATLCYTSLDVADRYIDAYRDRAYKEPSVAVGANETSITAAANQLNTNYNSSLSLSTKSRGILQFQPSTTWSTPQSNQPFNDGPAEVPAPSSASRAGVTVMGVNPFALSFITWRLHLRDFSLEQGIDTHTMGNYSAILAPSAESSWTSTLPEYGVGTATWVTSLFEYLHNHSSTAVALQGILTSLAGTEYYSRLRSFNKFDNISTVSFVNTNSPGGPLGRKRDQVPWGLTTVIALITLHLILTGVLTVRFHLQSRVSRIGDGWQAIAQVAFSRVDNLQRGLNDAIAPMQQRDTVNRLEEQAEGGAHHVHLVDEGAVVLKEP